MGSSLLLYGSKKLYKQYVFYRGFGTNPIVNSSKHYNQDLILYILANMLKTIRKEVGLNDFNNISDVEALAFFVNDADNNPNIKIKFYKARYQFQMVRLEIFLIDVIKFVHFKKYIIQ